MPQEAAGTLENALTRAGLKFRYINLFLETPKHLPLDQAAGLIVLGGPMNVDEVDKYPFLRLDVQWIEQSLECRLPLLGVCLGSQLLAKTLGAKVRANGVKEIGWYPIEWLPAAADDPLFRRDGRTTVFQWHGDTFDWPADAVPLARGELCEHQAFRYGATAYGLQFHIEMTAEMVENWLNDGLNREEMAGLDYIDPDRIRERTPAELPSLVSMAAEVFDRFAGLCNVVRRTECAPSAESERCGTQ
jgi:GMP synthase (glutamine-hydrolysing)